MPSSRLGFVGNMLLPENSVGKEMFIDENRIIY
jgi:hypothetical protein